MLRSRTARDRKSRTAGAVARRARPMEIENTNSRLPGSGRVNRNYFRLARDSGAKPGPSLLSVHDTAAGLERLEPIQSWQRIHPSQIQFLKLWQCSNRGR